MLITSINYTILLFIHVFPPLIHMVWSPCAAVHYTVYGWNVWCSGDNCPNHNYIVKISSQEAGANQANIDYIVKYIRHADDQQRKRSSGVNGDNLLKGSMDQSRMPNIIIEHIMSENNEHVPHIRRTMWTVTGRLADQLKMISTNKCAASRFSIRPRTCHCCPL